MAAHLCDLANAALQWAASGGVVGGNVHEWLLGYGLNNSTLDDSLQQLKLSTFQYENQIYDRTPHIKVDDYKHPGQVGRIYFALANDPARFIVDHVGQKLYLKEGKRLRKAR